MVADSPLNRTHKRNLAAWLTRRIEDYYSQLVHDECNFTFSEQVTALRVYLPILFKNQTAWAWELKTRETEHIEFIDITLVPCEPVTPTLSFIHFECVRDDSVWPFT